MQGGRRAIPASSDRLSSVRCCYLMANPSSCANRQCEEKVVRGGGEDAWEKEYGPKESRSTVRALEKMHMTF